jgi:hypothetical protein
VSGPGLGELSALLQVARRALAAGVPVGVLFDGQVPHIPGVAAVVPQHCFLGGCGEEPVPGHTNTLSDIADISGEVTRRFLPGLKTRVLHAESPMKLYLHSIDDLEPILDPVTPHYRTTTSIVHSAPVPPRPLPVPGPRARPDPGRAA